jgi:hypothetical protein
MSDYTSENLLQLDRSKDTKFKDQFNQVFREFFERPQTMKQVSIKTNIDRANICWYCRTLRKSNNIAPVKKTICPVTKHRAILWTTNPEMFPMSNQLSMF